MPLDPFPTHAQNRLVTNSSAPFSVIHANAAFLRLSGKHGTDAVLGAPFLSLLESASTGSSKISLTECMVASSMGNDLKTFLLAPFPSPPPPTNHDGVGSSTTQPVSGPVECRIRVSPIVARKTESREVTSVTHFAIELYDKESSRRAAIMDGPDGSSSSTMSSLLAASTDHLAVGVMG
jgi:hypothetical protein